MFFTGKCCRQLAWVCRARCFLLVPDNGYILMIVLTMYRANAAIGQQL